MKYVALLLVLLGGAICFGSKKICEKILKVEPTDEMVVKYKLAGLAVTVIGIVLILIFAR